MNVVTGPIDGITVLMRAITLANCPEDELESLCKRLRLLPPGAPYLIDERGNVYAKSWRKRTHRGSIQQCREIMRSALEKGAPRGTKLTHVEHDVEKPLRGESGWRVERARLLRVIPGAADGVWWQSLSLNGGDDTWTIATLDGLVAATCALLGDRKVLSRVRKCPQCGTWFIRQGKQTCCTPEHQRQRNRQRNTLDVWNLRHPEKEKRRLKSP